MTLLNEQRVALVTGATSGIGETVAEWLADRGCAVAVAGRDPGRGAAVVDRIGSGARFISAELREPGAAARLVARTVEEFGRLDVLVNNAGIDHTEALLDVGEAEIRELFEVNTYAPMNMLIAGARQMRAQGEGGSIINVTSRLATIGVPTMGVYSASKGAMHAFTTAAAVELAPHDIRVNSVAPGMTRTPFFEDWLSRLPNPEETEARVNSEPPLGRIATPEDVAAVVAFLASPEAAYLTGASIPVEGGYLAQ